MTAYEFTRFEADYTSKVRAATYQADTLASLLIQHNRGKDLRKQPDYKEAKDMFIECTMSCDPEEAISWMNYFIANAIAYGLHTHDTKWGYFFLAAFDLLKSLCGTYRR